VTLPGTEEAPSTPPVIPGRAAPTGPPPVTVAGILPSSPAAGTRMVPPATVPAVASLSPAAGSFGRGGRRRLVSHWLIVLGTGRGEPVRLI